MIRTERHRSQQTRRQRFPAAAPAPGAAGVTLAEALIYLAMATTVMAGIILSLASNIRSSQRLELKQRSEQVQGRLINLIENEVREGSEICKGVGCGNPDPEANASIGNNALGVFRSCLNTDPTNSEGVSLNDPSLSNMLFTIVIPVSRSMARADFLALQRKFMASSSLTEIPTLTPTVFGYNAVYIHYAQFTDPVTGLQSLYRCGPPFNADGSLFVDENAKTLPKAQLTILHQRTTLAVDSSSFPITDPQISTYRKGNALIYKLFIYPPPSLGTQPLFETPQNVIARTSATAIDPFNSAGVDD